MVVYNIVYILFELHNLEVKYFFQLRPFQIGNEYLILCEQMLKK